MSRTTRRKNYYFDKDWLRYLSEEDSRYESFTDVVNHFQRERSKEWMCNAPSWFRRSYNKKYRRKTKQQLNNHLATSDHEGLVIDKHYKNINWNWW